MKTIEVAERLNILQEFLVLYLRLCYKQQHLTGSEMIKRKLNLLHEWTEEEVDMVRKYAETERANGKQD